MLGSAFCERPGMGEPPVALGRHSGGLKSPAPPPLLAAGQASRCKPPPPALSGGRGGEVKPTEWRAYSALSGLIWLRRVSYRGASPGWGDAGLAAPPLEHGPAWEALPGSKSPGAGVEYHRFEKGCGAGTGRMEGGVADH